MRTSAHSPHGTPSGTSGQTRTDAYRSVQAHALRAWDEGLDFRDLARADAQLAVRVDLEDVFDLTTFTRHADVVFQRLQTLTRKEGVHA